MGRTEKNRGEIRVGINVWEKNAREGKGEGEEGGGNTEDVSRLFIINSNS